MRSATSVAVVDVARTSRRWPRTLTAVALIILLCEALLFSDVFLSGRGAIHSEAEFLTMLRPATTYAWLARLMAINMTPLIWIGYLLLLDGVLTTSNSSLSPARARPHHFRLLLLASVTIWCLFDTINFYFIDAWTYIGMPPYHTLWGRIDRYAGYCVAFAAIVPGMLMSGQVLLNLGAFDWARSRRWHMPRWAKYAALFLGAVMFAWPFVRQNPIANLTLWTSLVFLLDPINQKLGRPSMFRDWQNGWYGRTLAAFAGGLICGLLWEFWNYWALAKWTYHLQFLGTMENYRYFEMPLPGLLGFIPFGIECWVMWQTMRIPLDGLVEPLPDDRWLL